MPSESRMTPAQEGREPEAVLSVRGPLVAQLCSRARTERWLLAPEKFAEALRRSASSRFRAARPSPEQLARYLESLHLEDLALACACSEGCEAAWDFFMAQYRAELHRAARAIIGAAAGEARARELADSLYAELYGLSESGSVRRSLFDYFHGRSKLSTWLRAVLAQRHIDAIRAARRTESLDESTNGEERSEIPGERGTHPTEPPDPDRARYLELLAAGLGEAIASLAPRDRLRLSYYYVHERTLAEIGRILGEHEATVSRHLERTRRDLRQGTVEKLRAGRASGDGAAARGLSEAQIDICFSYAMGDWPFDLARAIGDIHGRGPDLPRTPKGSP